MPDFETTVHALRRWAGQMSAGDRAAVELLAWHETWLRRPDFTDTATETRGVHMAVNWQAAREFIVRGYRCQHAAAVPSTTSQRRILDIAVALGEDKFGLSGFGLAHKRAAAEAFAAACGESLEPAIPEVGHSHPSIIPGDPATCQRCALEASRD